MNSQRIFYTTDLMKICPNCASQNSKDACFCYKCGISLKSPMEIYPNLDLLPTSMYNWQKPYFASYIWMSLVLLSIVMLSCFLYWRTCGDYVEPYCYPLWIFILLIALYMLFSNQRKIRRLNNVNLQQIADYIQRYSYWGLLVG